MPRHLRLALPGIPLHVIQRGHNRAACFYVEDDYRFYLDQLRELALDYGCDVHAYCLMTNHVHLLLTPPTAASCGHLMKHLSQRHAQRINRLQGRSGSLWGGRFRSCLVGAEDYLMLCQRYIELNPVRAGMVAAPGDYPWSSYRANAAGTPELGDLPSPHPLYLSLGPDPAARGATYAALVEQALEPAAVDTIRRATNGGYALGGEGFQHRMSQQLDRPVIPGRAGRPPKTKITGV
jgi:putative transposase